MRWSRLVEPSPELTDHLQRRQARVLATALVVILPVWVVAVAASFATRAGAPSITELALAVFFTAVAAAAYVASRTRFYKVAVVTLILTSVVGSNIAGVVESDRVRVVVSMLYGMTGALYASIFMNTRATLLAAIGSLIGFIVFGLRHPVLDSSDFTLPMFLLSFSLALTVTASAVRASHLETIKAQSAQLAAIIASANDVVVAVDTAGRVTLWNSRAQAVFRLDASSAVGRPLAELIATEDAIEIVRKAIARSAPRFEFHFGEGRSFEASLSALSDGSGAVVVLRDITERKELEARLVLIDRLETMGRMVGGVAHEINNPLAYVQANLSELANGTPSDKERQELLAQALDGTRRMQTIVRDLLTFARGPSDREELTAVLVENTMESALHIAHVHATNAHATLIRQYSNVGTVMAVEARLGQVFLTLVLNAIQSLPANGGRREILVSTRLEGERVVIGVRDHGEGMTPEVRAKLFTPFFTTKPVGKGTGLGLSIAHTIVRSLGGEIRVESAKGRGSLFEVVVPIRPAAATATSGE